MASPSDSAALVALLRAGRRPWPQYSERVEQAGSARAVLERELEREGEQQTRLFGANQQPTPDALLRQAQEDVQRWQQQGLRLLSVLDPEYPPNLRSVHDRPPLIFLSGELRPTDRRSLAVIGSRRASAAGIELAGVISMHLAALEYTVVSGLAAGIDTAAHTAALTHGKRTLAVLGTGLRCCYPPENAQLQRRIAREGAVLSQFWPDAAPTKRSFPLRNAVMSGLTLGSVIVEASPTSGARVQARAALAHGRPVFLLGSLLAQAWARELARRPGTHVVDSPEEISALAEHLSSTGALTG
jgi:DNA processing protein